MTKITIVDFSKNETRQDATPLTLLQFIKVNLLCWGLYNAQKLSNRRYLIWDNFTGELVYEITG